MLPRLTALVAYAWASKGWKWDQHLGGLALGGRLFDLDTGATMDGRRSHLCRARTGLQEPPDLGDPVVECRGQSHRM